MKNLVIALFVALVILAIIKRSAIMEGVTKLVGIVTRSQFIDHYKNAVRQAVAGTGLFPSVMMAQMILESSDSKGNPGQSSLALNGNNFFGIKADKSWTGAKQIVRTKEYDAAGNEYFVEAAFRKYPSVLAGFKDRVKFLQQNARYKNAGVFSSKTPEQQAIALKSAGYATDPNYASILTNLINKNNLKSIDHA